MRFLSVLGAVLVCLLTLSLVATAADKNFGIAEVRHITFNDPVRIANHLLPAGEYVVRHTMQGDEHIMVFKSVRTKNETSVKCTLVPLDRKAVQSQTVYRLNAANEKVVEEVIFRGDSAKHVF
ncbi:MAG: hypothetical protein WCA16_07600 [Candidatus Sulfotelmatobacter sp.]